MIVWLNGLSGAGKSTVGNILFERLKPTHANLVLLDGDVLRTIWGDSLGYTVAARSINAARISQLCRFLDTQNIHAIASVMHMFPEWQDWYRETFSSYYEVFLDVPMEILEARDQKSLYSDARAGRTCDVVGVDIPFPRPVKANLIVSAPDVLLPAPDIADMIFNHLPAPLGA